MDSELDVDTDIRRLQSLLPVNPELYPECIRLSGVETILGLLSHENVDIVTDTIDLLSEIVEPDAIFTENREYVDKIVDDLVEKQVVEVCVSVLDRFDERVEDEARAVHDTLHILENLVELRPDICGIVAKRTKLIDWILTYVNDYKRLMELEERESSENGGNINEKRELQELLSGVVNRPNKLYMCEMLAIFLQTSEDVRNLMIQENRLDQLLQAIAFFHRVTPKALDELETAENLFNCLCASLMLEESQNLMREFDGIELMILFIRERHFARLAAVKCLYYCLMDNVANCVRFVNVGGIGTLFALLMAAGREDEDEDEDDVGNGKGKQKRKRRRKKRSESLEELRQHEEHLISMLNTLLRYFDATYHDEKQGQDRDVSMEASYVQETRDRILVKFTEKDLEKTRRIMRAFFAYYDRVREFDAQVLSGALEEILGKDIDDGEIYIERLSAGLFVLQQIICVIGDVMINNADIHHFILNQLERRGVAFEEIIIFLKEYMSNNSNVSERKRVKRIVEQLEKDAEKIEE